jgi:hypothetical protein
VAGLIRQNTPAVSGVIPKAGQGVMKGISWRISGERLFPHVYRKKAQTSLRQRMTSPV